MKMIRISVILISLMLIGSCKKKPEPAPATPAPVVPATNGTMSAQINGVNWTSTKNTAQFAIDTDNDLSALVINGETTADVIVLGIDFPTASTVLTVGSHDQGMTKDDVVFMYVKRTSGGGTLIDDLPVEGALNITAVDNANKKYPVLSIVSSVNPDPRDLQTV